MAIGIPFGANPTVQAVEGVISKIYAAGAELRTLVNVFTNEIPFILPPGTGSAGLQWTSTAGAFSVNPAMPEAYTHAYMYFPANQINGSNQAGWYYAQFGSTTAGVVYNNRYTGGKPSVPQSPTAFSGVTSGAYLTQVTNTEVVAVSFTLPGGVLSPGSAVYSEASSRCSGSTNNKSPRLRLTDGANTLVHANFNNTVSSAVFILSIGKAYCVNNTKFISPQLFMNSVNLGVAGGTYATATLNTQSPIQMQLTLQAQVNSEFIVCEYVRHDIFL